MNDWERIVREHGPMAARTALRILGSRSDAEDAMQEAFCDALRMDRAAIVANWGALLRRLATCRALDILRRRQAGSLSILATRAHAQDSPIAVAIAEEKAALLRKSLAQLPDREAQVFSLRYFAGLSNPEIAEALEITVKAAEVALTKARARLHELFDEKV